MNGCDDIRTHVIGLWIPGPVRHFVAMGAVYFGYGASSHQVMKHHSLQFQNHSLMQSPCSCANAVQFRTRGLIHLLKQKRLRPLHASSASASVIEEFPFPQDYTELLKQAEAAAQAALDDSKKLLEVEVPPAGLDTVTGDGEGGIEMNISMQLVQEFCQGLFDGVQKPRTRVFFPELVEMNLAKEGVFDGTTLKLDYLTKPSPWDDIGLGKKVKISERTKPTDSMFVVAYPHFNPNEMIAVEELYRETAKESGCPIIVFNGDMDKIRTGYYPPLFYPKLADLAKNFLPLFETVYYIHNFKGRFGGTLFRVYPGPWQVLRRVNGQTVCLHTQDTMPTLKQVALEILPSAKS